MNTTKKINITTIGWWNWSYGLLSSIKDNDDYNISAIISMSDSGWSTWVLREEFGILPPGDVRRALELLRFSGELAERENSEKIEISHVIKADKKSEKNRIIDIIKSQPKQFQLITYSIIKTSVKIKHNLVTNKKTKEIEPTTTGAVFDYYNNLAKTLGISSLSLRRISDIIIELEVLGIINFKIVSKGRYGRTRYITIGLPKTLFKDVIKILEEDLNLV